MFLLQYSPERQKFHKIMYCEIRYNVSNTPLGLGSHLNKYARGDGHIYQISHLRPPLGLNINLSLWLLIYFFFNI